MAPHVNWPQACCSDCLSWLATCRDSIFQGPYRVSTSLLFTTISSCFCSFVFLIISLRLETVIVCVCVCVWDCVCETRRSSFNHVIQTVCHNGICPHKKSCRYTFKFQRRVSLESSWVWPHPVPSKWFEWLSSGPAQRFSQGRAAGATDMHNW